jgi:hypothetical protein
MRKFFVFTFDHLATKNHQPGNSFEHAKKKLEYMEFMDEIHQD